MHLLSTPASTSWRRPTTPTDSYARSAAAARTSPSSTSRCRRPTPTRDLSPPSGSVTNILPSAVLVLSQYLEPSYAMRLLETHPEKVGYLLKERVFAAAVLVDALRRVAKARPWSTRRSSHDCSAVTAMTIRSPAVAPGTRGPRPRRRRPLESGDRRPPPRRRPDRRGARHPDLPQARRRHLTRLASTGAGGAHLPETLNTSLRSLSAP